MPLLDVRRFQGQFPRGSPGRSTRAVALPQARGQDPGAQALGRFGQVLERIGSDLSAIDAQFANAKAQTLSVEASTTLADEAQALQFQISTDPAIYPSDRADAFVAQIERRVETLGADVPELGRARYVAASSRAVQQATQQLRLKGYLDSIARATQANELEQERLQRILLSAPTEIERAEALGAIRANNTSMVALGAFTPEESKANFQAFVQDTAKLQLELLIELDPTAALAQLGTGVKGNPDIEVEELPALINLARQRWSGALQRKTQRDASDVREIEKEQIVQARQHANVIFGQEVTQAQLYAAGRALEQDNADEAIRYQDFLTLQRTVISRLLVKKNTSNDISEAESKRQRVHFENELLLTTRPEERVAELNEVLRFADNGGLLEGDLNAYLRLHSEIVQGEHITNQPSVREGLQLISFALAGVSTAEEFRLRRQGMSINESARLAEALATYASEMQRRRAAGEGLNAARQVAADWIGRYSSEDVLGALPTRSLPPEMLRMGFNEGLEHLKGLQKSGVKTSKELGRMFREWEQYFSPGRRFQVDRLGTKPNAPATTR